MRNLFTNCQLSCKFNTGTHCILPDIYACSGNGNYFLYTGFESNTSEPKIDPPNRGSRVINPKTDNPKFIQLARRNIGDNKVYISVDKILKISSATDDYDRDITKITLMGDQEQYWSCEPIEEFIERLGELNK